MRRPTKDELVEDAEDVGIPDAEDLTKAELEDALEERNPPELGPVVPPGHITAPPAPSSGKPAAGVRPQKRSDIPEAGR